MIKSLLTNHGKINLPAFMPDATYGSIRSTSFNDVKKAGIKEIVTTTLHIEQKLGSQYIKELGGLHNFFGWDRPILTDSGGWQVFSLINSKKGDSRNRISELGCSFVDQDSGKTNLLTPESSQVIQFNLGSDIVTVLDDPIIGNASLSERKESVRINTNWAKRSKDKFIELHKNVTLRESEGDIKPFLGCVIQGGDDFELRKRSAMDLLEIDFDIYNFGGIPLYSETTWKNDSPDGFYREMLQYVSELIPSHKLKYAMGVGHPEDIAFCVDAGWHLFDTVLPTRNARHGYLYVSQGQGDVEKGYKNLKYGIIHLKTGRYKLDNNPVDENCDCECCSTVSRAYLRHLIRISEPSGFRLATIHNLRFYSKWMELLAVR